MRNLILFLFISVFTTGFLFAQKATSADKQLKSLKGEVQKITITTDSGQVSFEGADARKLADRMKQKKHMETYSFPFNADSMQAHMPHMSSGKNGQMFIIGPDGDTLKIPKFNPADFKFDTAFHFSDKYFRFDSTFHAPFFKKLGKNMTIICDGDTLKFPEIFKHKELFNQDSLAKEIQLNLKINMKDLKDCLRTLKREMRSLQKEFDETDYGIDESPCDKSDAGHSGTKAGAKVKKHVIIKKKIKTGDDKQQESETGKEINNE
jgi:hypothetical protein